MSVCVALTLVLSIFVFRRVPRTSLLPLALFFICRPLDRTFSFTTFKLMKIYECEIHFTDFLAVEIIFFSFISFFCPSLPSFSFSISIFIVMVVVFVAIVIEAIRCGISFFSLPRLISSLSLSSSVCVSVCIWLFVLTFVQLLCRS